MNAIHNVASVILAVVLLGVGPGCGGKTTTDTGGPSGAETLFDRLGGKPGVIAVVDDFVARVGQDDRINHYFKNTDLARFKQLLVEQLCEVSGGPCTYSGRTMLEAHTGMNVTEEDWGITVQHLVDALDEHNVAASDKEELLGTLGAMKDTVVGQ